MLRTITSIVVPLLLPTAGYFLYVYFFGARRASARADAPESALPWAWLALAGGVLLALTFGIIAQFGGSPPGSIYVPAKVIDGKIEPGHFE